MKSQMKLAIGVFLFCFFLLPVSFGFSAEIYKWTDKDGKLIFSDTPPPPGVDSEIKKFEEPQSRGETKTQNSSFPAKTGYFTTAPGRDGDEKASTGTNRKRETKSSNNLSQCQERTFQREAVL